MIAEKQLFKRAILEALSQKYEQELAGCREDAKCSREHYLRVSEITGSPLVQVMGKRRSLRRTFVAVLIAAALLLAGCTAYVYRNAIKDFFEEVYDTHIKVSYSGEQIDNELYIKEFYSLSYVPEGYQLVREVKNEVCVRYIWESKSGDTLVFQQSLINESDFFLDSDTEDMQCIEYNGVFVYLRSVDNLWIYLWNDGKYGMYIDSDQKLSDDELEKIIDGIVILE